MEPSPTQVRLRAADLGNNQINFRRRHADGGLQARSERAGHLKIGRTAAAKGCELDQFVCPRRQTRPQRTDFNRVGSAQSQRAPHGDQIVARRVRIQRKVEMIRYAAVQGQAVGERERAGDAVGAG